VYDVEADEEASERANIEGTRNVIAFSNAHRVGRFHHVSSIAVAGGRPPRSDRDRAPRRRPAPRLTPRVGVVRAR
jgi:nucleoside-diphosphate-sugar epimerase